MNIGDVEELVLKQLPITDEKYYTLSDIVVESSDTSIALAIKDFYDSTENKGSGITGLFARLFGSNKDTDSKDTKAQKIVITAVNAGDADIIVRTNDGLVQAEPIHVHVEPSDSTDNKTITLSTFAASVAVNDKLKLTVKSIPGGKTDDSVFWESDDENIASVDPISGEITGISEGTCMVKAYVPATPSSAVYCLITVTADYTSTNVDISGSQPSKQWIKIEGQAVIILGRV
ncbi:MAG: Ig-like domain-containing protein [Oscillospiraceae bacterium]